LRHQQPLSNHFATTPEATLQTHPRWALRGCRDLASGAGAAYRPCRSDQAAAASSLSGHGLRVRRDSRLWIGWDKRIRLGSDPRVSAAVRRWRRHRLWAGQKWFRGQQRSVLRRRCRYTLIAEWIQSALRMHKRRKRAHALRHSNFL
jgi:hypothetical protein